MDALQHKGAGRRLRILLAEDDTLARTALVARLSEDFQVIEAMDVPQAREALSGDRPDMVVAAATLPGGGGGLLATDVRRLDKRLPFFLSGSAEAILAVLSRLSLPGLRTVVQPIDPDALAATLEDAAGETASHRGAEEAWELVRFFLDETPHLTAMLHGDAVVTVNRAFLRFMGLSSIGAFRSRGGDLERYLADPLPAKNLAAWALGLLSDSLDREHRLRLCNPSRPEQPPQVFQVAVSRLPGRDRCLLTLSDVTELELERRELLDLANLDPLTRAINRRKLQDDLADETARSTRYATALSVVMLDIDHFKAINDTHGHDAGDTVLVELVRRLAGQLRQVDRLARFGGEEFVVLTPGIDLDAATALAERLRQVVARTPFPGVGTVTASFGVAGFRAGEAPEAMLKRADEALYRAKHNGRNTVEPEASPQPGLR